jgi:lipopolysaccharide transport system ATP-binding protein
MEEEVVLSVKNLSKVYQKNKSETLYALNDISFELAKGEMLGVIGRNGSGKTTLLKVLSEITAPSSGTAKYDGILTSIIEIGTGFHMDLPGKENTYLSSRLLGYSKSETAQIYDQIVEFSGMSEFMDTPVKHYSSGMYLRLAFSIAFHAKIDILLLDEVMAVGDAAFRRKCYSKIRELKENGTSIIFVSHQMEPVVELCDRCMWFDNGEIKAVGFPMDVIENYLENAEDNKGVIGIENVNNESQEFDLTTIESDFIEINELQVKAKGKGVDDDIYMNDAIEIIMECDKKSSDGSFEVVYSLTNLNGVRVLIDSYGLRKDYVPGEMEKGMYTVQCTIPPNLLNRGVYRIGMILGQNTKYVKEIPSVGQIKVLSSTDLEFDIQISTIIRPQLNWEIKKVQT